MVPLFCRHNRFTADCPICSRGTVLEPPRRGGERQAARTRSGDGAAAAAPRRRAREERAEGATPYRGPYGSVGPYVRDGASVEVRLERVPGGLRLGEWSGATLLPCAPALAAGDLAALVEGAAEAGALRDGEREELLGALASPAPSGDAAGGHGASPGRSGELREELRVERLDDGRVRVARWILRPGTGWELVDAPPILPARRYAEALRQAARLGVLG